MNYSYSICHPDKRAIERPSELLDEKGVISKFENYPWVEILNRMEAMNPEDIEYSPSIGFKNIENNYSLELTAQFENGNLEFSLWYERLISYRVFFGLFGNSTKLDLVDKFEFDKNMSLEVLKKFLNQEYDFVEKIMTK